VRAAQLFACRAGGAVVRLYGPEDPGRRGLRRAGQVRLPAIRASLLAACMCFTVPAADNRALFQKARTLEQAGEWAGAEAAYRQYLKRDPASAEALSNLGVVLARQGKYEAAAESYGRALRLRPSLAALYLNLGIAYYKAERRDLAIEQFRIYLQKDPASRQARQLLATALLETDHFQEAAEVFETLLPSDDFAVRLGLAAAYVRMSRNREAQRLLDELLGREDSPQAQVLLGQALLAENRLEDAANAFRTALRLNPNMEGVHFLLGAARWKAQDAAGAIAEWREELRQDPQNFDAVFALGASLAENGAAVEATIWLERARRMRPNHAPTLYHLGKLAWKAQRPEALELLERSVKLDPSNRAAHYLLAQIYRACGRQQDADRALAVVNRLSEDAVRQDLNILEGFRRP
jgi:tetratricopeptide (TPR) repeat protein